MKAVDASALVAIAMREQGHRALVRALMEGLALIGLPTLQETFLVLHRRAVPESTAWQYCRFLSSLPNVSLISFDAVHLYWAQFAFDQNGKGGGSGAGLNFGDCMAYSVARQANVPLLFTGGDFPRTDLKMHPASIVP